MYFYMLSAAYFITIRSSLRKVPAKSPGIPEFKLLFQQPAALSDQPSVDQRTEESACLDAFKMSETEKQKRQDDSQRTAAAVIDCFYLCNIRTCFAEISFTISS